MLLLHSQDATFISANKLVLVQKQIKQELPLVPNLCMVPPEGARGTVDITRLKDTLDKLYALFITLKPQKKLQMIDPHRVSPKVFVKRL